MRSQQKQRRCLRCNRCFLSVWAGHRLCGKCQREAASIPPQLVAYQRGKNYHNGEVMHQAGASG